MWQPYATPPPLIPLPAAKILGAETTTSINGDGDGATTGLLTSQGSDISEMTDDLDDEDLELGEFLLDTFVTMDDEENSHNDLDALCL